MSRTTGTSRRKTVGVGDNFYSGTPSTGPLDPIEERILEALSQGKDLKDLVSLLKISKHTVYNRSVMLRERLGAANLVQAVHLWTLRQPRPRRAPEPTRTSRTFKTVIYSETGPWTLYITLGYFPEGGICEVFANVGKYGGALRGLLDSWSKMVSVSIQYGVPLEDILAKFRHTAFEPAGKTTNPEIPTCSSVLDYTVQIMERHSRFNP